MRKIAIIKNETLDLYCRCAVCLTWCISHDWTLFDRDDTPHVPNEQLGEEPVLRIIGNLTHIIKSVFPSMCFIWPTNCLFLFLFVHEIHCTAVFLQTPRCILRWEIMTTIQRTKCLQRRTTFTSKQQTCGTTGSTRPRKKPLKQV